MRRRATLLASASLHALSHVHGQCSGVACAAGASDPHRETDIGQPSRIRREVLLLLVTLAFLLMVTVCVSQCLCLCLCL